MNVHISRAVPPQWGRLFSLKWKWFCFDTVKHRAEIDGPQLHSLPNVGLFMPRYLYKHQGGVIAGQSCSTSEKASEVARVPNHHIYKGNELARQNSCDVLLICFVFDPSNGKCRSRWQQLAANTTKRRMFTNCTDNRRLLSLWAEDEISQITD